MQEPAHADHAQTGADDCPERESIQSLDDLWQRVGIRAMALPKVGRAGVVLVDKTAAASRDRLTVARAAQLAAIARHTRKPMPASVPTDPDDDRHVDRSEAQDLHAWNE